jgi:hypothetical protein
VTSKTTSKGNLCAEKKVKRLRGRNRQSHHKDLNLKAKQRRRGGEEKEKISIEHKSYVLPHNKQPFKQMTQIHRRRLRQSPCSLCQMQASKAILVSKSKPTSESIHVIAQMHPQSDNGRKTPLRYLVDA